MNRRDQQEHATLSGYEWWPIEAITTNPQGAYVQVLRDNWWCFDDQGRVLMFRELPGGPIYPQCNSHRLIVERHPAKNPAVVEIRQIPLALVPIRIEDFR